MLIAILGIHANKSQVLDLIGEIESGNILPNEARQATLAHNTAAGRRRIV
jgi:hypothetical protein